MTIDAFERMERRALRHKIEWLAERIAEARRELARRGWNEVDA